MAAGRALHERVVDLLRHQHRAHRHRAVGEPLGARDDVRRHAEFLRGERRAGAAEAGDHLVEDQQDAVLVADLAQALEIALRRNQHAGRTRDRLDDHRGDRRCVVQRDQPLEIVGELGAVRRQAARERVARRGRACARRWSTPGIIAAGQALRLATMPPTLMPPKPTP